MAEFKPFDKILVRDNSQQMWKIDFFEQYSKDENYPYCGLIYSHKYCVPYEGNEHLLGTCDSALPPEEFNFGDQVQVKDDDEGEWKRAIFVKLNTKENPLNPYLVIIEGEEDTIWCSFCRHIN